MIVLTISIRVTFFFSVTSPSYTTDIQFIGSKIPSKIDFVSFPRSEGSLLKKYALIGKIKINPNDHLVFLSKIARGGYIQKLRVCKAYPISFFWFIDEEEKKTFSL